MHIVIQKLVLSDVGFASYFSSSLRSVPLALSLVPAKKSEEPPWPKPIFESRCVYTALKILEKIEGELLQAMCSGYLFVGGCDA